jgi:uncharacterized membrane protein YqjE
MATDPLPPRDEGLTGSLRRLARTLLRVLQTRLEILSTEMAEERIHLTRLVLVVLGVVFCLYAGLTLALVFVVLAASPENRLAAIGISALFLLLGALSGVLWLRAWLKRRPAMFATTIAELRKDRERLGGPS